MKVCLVGYPGSQCIVKASKYLTEKYLLRGFGIDSIWYINYKGDINGWSTFMQGYFEALHDEYIVFGLDDYLISDSLDIRTFWEGFNEMRMNKDIVCVKLCHSTEQEHLEYPVTTQWTIWNREYLISLLEKVNNPWSFEIDGSKIFDKICLHRPCLKYFTNSAISSRWEGIRLDGLKQGDIDYINNNGLL